MAEPGRPPDSYDEPPRRRGPRRPAGPPPPWWRENPWLSLAMLGVLVAAGVIIAIFALRDNGDDNAQTVTVTRGTTTSGTTTTTTSTTTTRILAVPQVVGQTQIDAGTTVQDAGFVPNSYPVPSTQQRGSVVAQNPPGGTNLAEGKPVRLNTSVGETSRPNVQVPDVTGPEANDAREAIWDAKLTCKTLTRPAPDSESVGEVLAQQPAAGTTVQQFAQVVIYVGI